MRISIRHVAERAGVSAMTVSRVLRGQGKLVSEDAQARILAAVEELNYVPVRATTLQNRHVETHVIGLVPYYVNFPQNQLDALTYEGICRAARAQGHDLLVMLRDEADWMANRREVRFLDRRSDGFIFVSPGAGEWNEALTALAAHEIPAVVCYRRDVPAGVAWIDPDNEEIVRLGVACLRAAGHRRIAYLEGVTQSARRNYDDVQRKAAFKKLTRNAAKSGFDEAVVLTGATPDWTLHPDVLPELQKRNITGVLCLNDLLALHLWRGAEAAKLRVPRDLSIIGVDDSAEGAARGLSSVAFAYQDVGELAVEAWMLLKRGNKAEDASRVVPVRLAERASVARVQKEKMK